MYYDHREITERFDEIDEDLQELRGLLFVHECAELFLRDAIPNIRHNASTYDQDTMQRLRNDVISLYHQKLFDITINIRGLEKAVAGHSDLCS